MLDYPPDFDVRYLPSLKRTEENPSGIGWSLFLSIISLTLTLNYTTHPKVVNTCPIMSDRASAQDETQKAYSLEELSTIDQTTQKDTCSDERPGGLPEWKWKAAVLIFIITGACSGQYQAVQCWNTSGTKQTHSF